MDIEFPLELAEKIVFILHEVTGNNVNFMGQGGIIRASMQKDRIGAIHEGAKRIMDGEINELAITVEDAAKLNGAKPGYNGIVLYQNQRLGCIGISGDPEKMRPLQKMAAIVAKEEYEKYLFNQNRNVIIEKVTIEVEEVSAAIEQITAGSLESLNHIQVIEEIANSAEKALINVNDILTIINHVNEEVELLGLNAAIEAARAGDAGRGFGIVAKEIQKLSYSSNKSVKDINQFLNEVQKSITEIAKGIRSSSKISQEQASVLQNISANALEIQNHTQKLNEIEQNN